MQVQISNALKPMMNLIPVFSYITRNVPQNGAGASMHSRLALLMCAVALLLLSACSSAVQEEDPSLALYTMQEDDPLEPFNRTMFAFNETVDHVLLSPAAHLYRDVVPPFGRDRVGNFLDNLAAPVSFVNALAQGESELAFTVLWRFLLNSTLGGAGLFDFAGHHGITARTEDFGQTLGVYGVRSGVYIVWPFIGPSNTRDSIGRVVDAFSNPFSYIFNRETLIAERVLRIVHEREQLLELTDEIYRTSLDPYITIRSGYLQRREAQINNYGE